MSTTHSKHFNRWLYLAVILFVLSLVPLLAFSQTVTSVVPNSVRLEPGGKEVAITINGSGLDKITSVQVVMNNQPVKEFLVVLGPATLKGRQVTLKASPQAMIGTNYQLRLMIGTTPVNLPTQIVQVQVVKAVAVGGKGETPTPIPPPTPGKVIKHEPRPLKPAEVDRHRQLVTTKKLTPIPFKAFTYQDFKDPKTGSPIKPDTIITLKNGKQIKGQDFINQINGLEQQFNTFGHTFKKPRKTTISAQGVMTQPAVLQESVINTKLMQNQRVKAAPAFQKLDPSKMKVKPYDKSSFQVVTRAAPRRIAHQVVPQNLQQIVNAIKPYHYEKSYDQDWGDRDWFAVGLHAKMILDADQNKMKTYAEGRATGTVFNQDWDIVRVTGLAEAPTQTAGQKMHAKLVANVCGDTFFNYEDSQDGSLLWGEDKSIDVHERVSFHFVIVVIPVEATLGFRGSAGIYYGFELAPLKAKVLFAPYVKTEAYAQVAVDLVVAKGGVGGELTLLNASLPIGATVGVETGPNPFFFAEYYIQNTVNALSGSIYVFVEVDLWLWSDSWSWDIFKWDGFKYDGYVVNDRKEVPIQIIVDPKIPPVIDPPKITKYNLAVSKPVTGGIGTVTSSPPGINCGYDCNEYYNAGEKVTLTATAAAESYFEGWSGGGCSGIGPCTVTMNAATTVTATFTGKDAYNVQIFEHTKHTGLFRTYTLVPGQCQVLDPDFTKTGWNDTVSSVKVGSKVSVVLFNSIHYSGDQVALTGDTLEMPKGWNDKASSLIVYLKENGSPIGAMLRGKHWQFLPVNEACTRTEYPTLYHNDDATQVRVMPHFLGVTVFKLKNFGGDHQNFIRGEWQDISKNLKGKGSSAKIEIIEEMQEIHKRK